MPSLKEKGILWIGMVLVATILFFAIYLAWDRLVSSEATRYGKELVERLRQVVVQIDAETGKAMTPELYQRLHHTTFIKHPLAKVPEVVALVKKLGAILQNPEGGASIFTDCPSTNKADCYDDFLFEKENKTYRKNYSPKDRPWYLVTKAHGDWVVVHFMTGKRRITGYPTAWTIGFVRQFLMPTDSPGDGLWLLATTPNATEVDTTNGSKTAPFLKMLFEKAIPPFKNFDVDLKTLRFTKEMLDGSQPPQIYCDAITQLEGLSYTANVDCRMHGEPIQFLFTKKFDHPVYCSILILIGVVLLYIAYRFFSAIIRLQQQNIQGQLSRAISGKLIHDLKKGILVQLNRIHEEDKNWEHHYQYLELLNKYVEALNKNLKQERETDWIPFTLENFKKVLALILGPMTLREETTHGKNFFLEMQMASSVTLKSNMAIPFFLVPEMSFYRILKNILENYNTYGSSPFTLTFSQKKNQIEMKAANPVERRPSKESPTHLGLAIIRQLLRDNFGSEASLEERQTTNFYCLTLKFPIVEKII